MLLILFGGGVIAAIFLLLVWRGRRTASTAGPPQAYLLVRLWYKTTPDQVGWLPCQVLLPVGIPECDIDSTALALAAAQFHHAGLSVTDLRVQYIGRQRVAHLVDR
jgi:hypothetical protein